MPGRQTQRRGKNFSKLSKKKAKKYYHFTEEAQPDRFADTEGEYWYEETEGGISFIDPVEHCDYESSEEEEDESVSSPIGWSPLPAPPCKMKYLTREPPCLRTGRQRDERPAP